MKKTSTTLRAIDKVDFSDKNEEFNYALGQSSSQTYRADEARQQCLNLQVPQIADTFIREVNVEYRTTKTSRKRVQKPDQAASLIRDVLIDNSREQVVVLFLDGAHQVASYSIIAVGSANQCQVHPREIFQRAVMVGAVSIILGHNHPSGNTSPSEADISLTKRIKDAGELLAIPLLDHVIVGDFEHTSLLEIDQF